MRKLILILAVTALSGCREKRDHSPVIARVNSAQLTLQDLQDALPENSGLEMSHIQVQRFIQQWIETELIYQEAVRRGFDKQPKVERQIERLTKDVVVLAFLERIIDQNEIAVSEEEIQQFYDDKGDEFIREKDQYLLHLIRVQTRQEAIRIRTRLVNGEPFDSLAREHSLDSSREQGGNLGWVTLEQIPTALSEIVPGLSLNSPSRPLRTQLGYYILLLESARKKGEKQELEEVRDDIEWRIVSVKKEEDQHRLLNMLRQNARLEIDWDVIRSNLSNTLGE